MCRGAFESACSTDSCHRTKDTGWVQSMKIAADSQDRQCGALHYLADADDGLAIEVIRNMPDEERQQEHRQKLHQPHHA